MSALGIMLKAANAITDAKKEAIRTGANRITYTDHNGHDHTLYYYSLRWHDRPSTISEWRKHREA